MNGTPPDPKRRELRSGSRWSRVTHASPLPAPHVPSARRAVLLSFALPGLGELYLGNRRRAAIRSLPVIAVAGWLLALAGDGLTVFAFQLLDPMVATLLFWLIVVTGILRLVSILDAGRMARLAGGVMPRRLIAVLLAASLAAHGLAGWYAQSFASAGTQIFVGRDSPNDSPGPIASFDSTAVLQPDSSIAPDSSADPFAAVTLPTPARTSSRINVLLLGADSGLGYSHALTDSQIVVSIDTAAPTVIMASLPRDVAQFAFYAGGTYQGKINSLMSTAASNPARYPDGGIGTLAREIGFLLGIDIHYYAFVNLAGFGSLIDAVGGIDVVNPKQIADAGYQFPDGQVGFFMKPGSQHLDSRIGLAFVRTREGIGDDDYTRAQRQQLVLQALRDRMTSSAMVPRLPGLLDALAKTVKTDFPVGRASEMLSLAQQIPNTAIQKVVLGPPYAVNPPMSTTGGEWILRLDMAAVSAWSIEAFGPDSAYAPAPSPLASPR